LKFICYLYAGLSGSFRLNTKNSVTDSYYRVSQIYDEGSLYEERAIKIKLARISILSILVTSTTLSSLALTMLSIQEASAAKCNSNDHENNKNNDDSTTTCANQQRHSKNHDSSDSNTKSSIPFRLPMPFP
jgi:hypothetical protein